MKHGQMIFFTHGLPELRGPASQAIRANDQMIKFMGIQPCYGDMHGIIMGITVNSITSIPSPHYWNPPNETLVEYSIYSLCILGTHYWAQHLGDSLQFWGPTKTRFWTIFPHSSLETGSVCNDSIESGKMFPCLENSGWWIGLYKYYVRIQKFSRASLLIFFVTPELPSGKLT